LDEISLISLQFNDDQNRSITGRNGSGNFVLLKMIAETNADAGYVPQMIEEFDLLSGGERVNRAPSG
jgi:ABC-type molybdenum transport system ATPase subunit/photorepair protein PhrA